MLVPWGFNWAVNLLIVSYFEQSQKSNVSFQTFIRCDRLSRYAAALSISFIVRVNDWAWPTIHTLISIVECVSTFHSLLSLVHTHTHTSLVAFLTHNIPIKCDTGCTFQLKLSRLHAIYFTMDALATQSDYVWPLLLKHLFQWGGGGGDCLMNFHRDGGIRIAHTFNYDGPSNVKWNPW